LPAAHGSVGPGLCRARPVAGRRYRRPGASLACWRGSLFSQLVEATQGAIGHTKISHVRDDDRQDSGQHGIGARWSASGRQTATSDQGLGSLGWSCARSPWCGPGFRALVPAPQRGQARRSQLVLGDTIAAHSLGGKGLVPGGHTFTRVRRQIPEATASRRCSSRASPIGVCARARRYLCAGRQPSLLEPAIPGPTDAATSCLAAFGRYSLYPQGDRYEAVR
jgi:hypothetical protein